MAMKFRPPVFKGIPAQAKNDASESLGPNSSLEAPQPTLKIEEPVFEPSNDLPAEMFSQEAEQLLEPQAEAVREVNDIWPPQEDLPRPIEGVEVEPEGDGDPHHDWDDWEDANNILQSAAADEEELHKQRISALWPCVRNVFASELERLSSSNSSRALERLYRLAETGAAQVLKLL